MTPGRIRLHLLTLTACVVWLPGVSIDLGIIGLQAIEITALLLAVLWLLAMPTTRGRASGSEICVVLLFLALTAQTLVQISLVADSAGALRYLKSILVALVIYLAFLQHATRRDDAGPIHAFVLCGVLVALLTGLDFTTNLLGGATRDGFVHGRAKGFAEHANQFAIWLNALLPMAILVPRRTSTSLLCAAIVLFAVFITGSKFNLGLALVVAYVALGIRLAMPFLAWVMAGAALLAILSGGLIDALVSAMGILNPAYSDAFGAALQDPLSARSLLSRQALWRTAWSVGSAHPLLGFGAGQAHIVLGLSHAHNAVLHYFLTHGIFGVVFVLGVFGCGMKIAMKGDAPTASSARTRAALALSITTVFIANMSSDSLSGQQLALLALLLGFISLAVRGRPQPIARKERALQVARS